MYWYIEQPQGRLNKRQIRLFLQGKIRQEIEKIHLACLPPVEKLPNMSLGKTWKYLSVHSYIHGIYLDVVCAVVFNICVVFSSVSANVESSEENVVLISWTMKYRSYE